MPIRGPTWLVITTLCASEFGCSDQTTPSEASSSSEADSQPTTAEATSAATGHDPNEAEQTTRTPTEADTQDEQASADEGPRFDLPLPDSPDTGDELKYSYIWIANAEEGTVSKINTRTLVEEGRYVTRPDGQGDPSRTSVSLSGHVAVANRAGGITKIYADPSLCHDANGDGKVTTAHDKQFLAWGQEECIAWHRPLDYQSQRAVAWTAERVGEDSWAEQVWVTGIRAPDPSDPTEVIHDIDVLLLDGDDGAIMEQITVTLPDLGFQPSAFPYGAYGGAVDHNNDFWWSGLDHGVLVRVRHADMGVDIYDKPQASYGLTVDGEGYPWVCGVDTARFDPATEQFTDVPALEHGKFKSGGCMVDAHGQLWMDVFDGTSALAAIDTHTLELVHFVPVEDHPHGISVDFFGYVWGVTRGDRAFRLDPLSYRVEEYAGLNGAYTYSDMTGFALSQLHVDPEGRRR